MLRKDPPLPGCVYSQWRRTHALVCTFVKDGVYPENCTLKPGAAADVVLFDPEESWIVEPEKMHSKARNTPFKGMTLKGRVKATVLDGRIVYDIR